VKIALIVSDGIANDVTWRIAGLARRANPDLLGRVKRRAEQDWVKCDFHWARFRFLGLPASR
jgi:hypothetical protein